LQAPPETQAAIQPPAPTRSIPTINELNLQGVHALPALHMDIHVYATQPADRFIFLNSRKYREGAQTPEGITIERITPEGAILNRNGLQFLLPRP
jgi:general secretion pathway protein B